MSRFLKFFSPEKRRFETEMEFSEEYSGTWLRCPDCKRIVAKCETFTCDECDYENREKLCDACGSKNHDHRPIAESTPISNSTEQSYSFSSMVKSYEDMMIKFESQSESGTENYNSTASSINEPLSLAARQQMAENIYEGMLAEFHRERKEINQRQIQLGQKQTDFLAAFCRFNTDVRALFAGDQANVDNRIAETGSMGKSRTIKENNNGDNSYYERKTNPDERQIFLYGLPLNVREEDLAQLFSDYGVVVGVKKLRKKPGKMISCALVAFESASAARAALNSPPSFDQFGGGSVHVEPKCTTSMLYLPDTFKIRVTNLPRSLRLSDLKEFFDEYGSVLAAKLRHRRTDSSEQNYAYIAFNSAEAAARVAEKNTYYFGKNLRPIYVELADGGGRPTVGVRYKSASDQMKAKERMRKFQ